MLTKYFNFLSDILIENYEPIAVTTKFFKKDTEVILSLWHANMNRTFFNQYLEKFVVPKDIYDMKKIVDDNFSASDSEKILKGRHQNANFLRLLWLRRSNRNNTNAIMEVTGYKADVEVLKNLLSFAEFMEFLGTMRFSQAELIEFFVATASTRIITFSHNENVDVLRKQAKKLLNEEGYAVVEKAWMGPI